MYSHWCGGDGCKIYDWLPWPLWPMSSRSHCPHLIFAYWWKERMCSEMNYSANLLHVIVKEILCNIHCKKQLENVICSMQARHLFIKFFNMWWLVLIFFLLKKEWKIPLQHYMHIIEGCHHEIMKIIEPWNSYEPADRKIWKWELSYFPYHYNSFMKITFLNAWAKKGNTLVLFSHGNRKDAIGTWWNI